MKKKSQTHAAVIDRLNDVLKQLNTRGIVVWNNYGGAVDGEGNVVKNWWKKRPPITYTFTVRKLVRQMCREMGRPFVWAEGGYYFSYDAKGPTFDMHLTIPRRQKHAPLVACLLLMAEKTYWQPTDKPLSIRDTEKSNFRFRFHGEQGREMFEQWLDRCQREPAKRKVLCI